MRTTIAIRAVLAEMPAGKIFTTRDLVGMGRRDAVDKCLKRLVDSGIIVRLARGVFSNGSEMPYVTPLQLAQAKAGAFHKEVIEHASTVAQRLGYTPKPKEKNKHTFATNGTGSSSFQSVCGTIQLKATSARKRNEFSDEVWELVKSLWHLGKNGISTQIRNHIVRIWGRRSQESLHTYCASIPQWLVEQLPGDVNGSIKKSLLNLIPRTAYELSDRYHESVECKEMVRNMPPGFSTFEPPPREHSEYEDIDDSSPPECSCPESDECICPMFTCSYCMSQPINNRFSIALGCR